MNTDNYQKIIPPKEPDRLVKNAIWAYFILLIIEGALRKWFLPFLATPLLIVRDPLALGILFICWKRNLLSFDFYMISMVILGLVATVTTLVFGHGNLQVALYGGRALLLHWPLIFVIGKVFNRQDVIKIGKVCLYIAIPMVILIGIQFYSPQSAWVNKGLNDEVEGGGFSGALGFFRPPGTFSFTNGNSLFFSLVACFVFYFWLNAKYINKLLLILATAALLISIPLSISRSLLFQVILSLLFTVIAVLYNPRYSVQMIKISMMTLIALMILSNLPFFQVATEAFSTRFEQADDTEGGLQGTLGDRFFGDLTLAFAGATDQPYFGQGLGMGTNAGSKLMTGDREFLIAEGEWGRVIGEMGLVLGLALIIIRISFSIKLVLASFRKLTEGDMLPWMLLSYAILILTQGGWAQPTPLGFHTLIAGLLLASLNHKKEEFVPITLPASSRLQYC